jgi:hypothetical protein
MLALPDTARQTAGVALLTFFLLLRSLVSIASTIAEPVRRKEKRR